MSLSTRWPPEYSGDTIEITWPRARAGRNSGVPSAIALDVEQIEHAPHADRRVCAIPRSGTAAVGGAVERREMRDEDHSDLC
jgi:hypothetical protein